MLSPDHLKLIANLRYDPGYVLLCDLLQKVVDDMADDMAVDDLPAEKRLDKLSEWRAARKIVTILKTQPQAFDNEVKEDKPKGRPSELTDMDPSVYSRLKILRNLPHQVD